MILDFDLGQVQVTEFGIGRDEGNARSFYFVTVDGDVQTALQEMAQASWTGMQTLSDDPPLYQPSEKHGGLEYLHLPLTDNLASSMRALHEAHNLPIDPTALETPESMFCYFARFVDSQDRRLTALRRAAQFKGVLKSRLLRFHTDALKIVEEQVFRLDTDFDLLIDSQHVHILRPNGFEFAGQLQDAIMAAVTTNVASLRTDLTYVNFESIENYAKQHPRAARYLASIRSQTGIQNIDRNLLSRLCASTGVETAVIDDQITVAEKHVLGFLEVLDRRRYEIELIVDVSEQYRAASRSKLGATGLQ